MEPIEEQEQPSNQTVGANNAAMVNAASQNRSSTAVVPQQSNVPCSTCGGAAVFNPNSGGATFPSFIYALGRIEPRFPTLSLEKEFHQATGREGTVGLTDRQALYKVLSNPRNRYIARKMCWVLSIENVDTYILQPRHSESFDDLLEALNTPPDAMEDVTDVDAVIGERGPIAPPEICGGAMIPIVIFDQIYPFTLKDLVESLQEQRESLKGKPRDSVFEVPIEEIPDAEFTQAANAMFRRIHQLTDNAGAADEHRALNYLALREPKIYLLAAERYHQENSLTDVEVRPSRLSGARKVMDVVFSFTSRNTGVTEKFFIRVDVTEDLPFLVSKLSRFYDR